MALQDTSSNKLSFQNGEDVLLCHLNNGRRTWLHGAEAFSKAIFHTDHVEFKSLDDNGHDIEDTQKIERTYRESYFRGIGEVAYNSAVQFENGEWVWNRTGVPLPTTVEQFRDCALNQHGANDFSFVLHKGDGADGEFTLETIMNALRNKSFPIGANAGYFVHDMNDHSVGMAAIDKSCAESLSTLAQFAIDLKESNPSQSRHLAESIATYLDYYSYFKFFAADMATKNVDPILTSILRSARAYDEHSINIMKSIIASNDYRITSKLKVMRAPGIIKYYSIALKVLDPKPTS